MGNNFLVMGPWRHSQINREGRSLGPFEWDGDTAAQFRKDMVLPLFNQYLKDGPPAQPPAATITNTGENPFDHITTCPPPPHQGLSAPQSPSHAGPSRHLGLHTSAHRATPQ